MSFDNVLASLDSGKADLAISGVSKTEERSRLRFFKFLLHFEKYVYQRKTGINDYQSVKTFWLRKGCFISCSRYETWPKKLYRMLLSFHFLNGTLIIDLKSGQLDGYFS